MTQSTHSSIYAYPTENGRRYHAYKQGCYFLPNDEREQDRMELQRLAIHHSLQGQLYFAPLSSGGGRRRGGWQTPPAPRRILDLGTGSGAWAVEMADRFPEAEVTGVDLSPIQPTLVPPNVQFEIDDVEDVWTWPLDHFDLIFSSLMLSGSIADRQNYFHQAFR
jgi:SAM-dependent methyltransferase